MENLDVLLVQEFWDWFKSVSDDLSIDPIRRDLITTLDNLISQLGHFDWEIGPWENNLSYLAISPNLNIDRLALARQVIEYAPICDGWIFLASKPPRDWKGIWKMRNEKNDEIFVDSNDWKYILYEFDDKTYDMDLFVEDIDGDDSTINLAIDIALTGYLGEEMFLHFIKNIQVVKIFQIANNRLRLNILKSTLKVCNPKTLPPQK